MGHACLPVRRKPRVAILATGDELVLPGEAPGPDQIVASNIYALAALVARAGGEPLDLGIARDTFADLERSVGEARARGADLLVTLGGASVGEHDLVQSALARQGMDLGFWRVALRPGKPLLHGRLGAMLLLGLPGNPVSSIVCGILFVVPAIRALLGDPAAGDDPGEAALLGADASIAGIGTDGGGSIRAPSHFCGTVGIRPTVGRTPETGLWPPTRATGMMDMTCVGPMGRYVEDLALLLAVIAGADGVDPYAVDMPLGDPAALDVAGMRVAFYAEHPRVPRATPGTAAAVRAAAGALERLGAHVEEIAPTGVDAAESATELFFATSGADGGAGLRRAVAAAGGRHHPQFAAILGDGSGPAPSAEAFFATQERFFAFRAAVRRVLVGYDLVLSPVVAGPAPRHGAPPAGLPMEDYLRYEAFEPCHVNAVAGVPAAVVPVGVEDGLPVGVQVAAGPWREDVALAGALALESAFGGFAISRGLAAAAA
jgi:molybdenum cofactor synthesis domain-containing protein